MKLVHVVLAVEVPDDADPTGVAYDFACAWMDRADTDERVVSACHSQALDECVATEAESAELEAAAEALRPQAKTRPAEFREAQREFRLIQELRTMHRTHLPRLLLRELVEGGSWTP